MIRVMVVEDNRDAMDITCRYIGQIDGFAVVGTADNGDDAKTMTLELKPDLLVLDIDIPGKNGVDLLGELRREDHGVEALFLTATDDPAVRARAEALGIVDYLVKPIGLEQLKESLMKCGAV